MQNLKSLVLTLFFIAISMTCAAQRLSIKPFWGYYVPRLSDVNNDIASEIPVWSDLLETQITSPGKIKGNSVFGGQIQFHLRENYFVNLNISYYRGKAETEFTDSNRTPAGRFFYFREVKSYDVVVNLQYYFDYDAGNFFNTYISIGGGVIAVNANTDTESNFTSSMINNVPLPQVDTHGEFSGSTLTAVLAGGVSLHFSDFLSIWSEAGFQVSNIGQLEGSVSRINNAEIPDFTTNTSFDLTGVFIRLGADFGLQF
ncbi:MAG: hypothetical protein ACE5I1_06340 [bacterium]